MLKVNDDMKAILEDLSHKIERKTQIGMINQSYNNKMIKNICVQLKSQTVKYIKQTRALQRENIRLKKERITLQRGIKKEREF